MGWWTHVVVGSGVETWARTTDIILSWGDKGVGGVAWCGHLIATLAVTRLAVLGAIVRVLGVIWCCRYVIGVERAGSRTTCASPSLLSSHLLG